MHVVFHFDVCMEPMDIHVEHHFSSTRSICLIF